jgi:hypothetical protein
MSFANKASKLLTNKYFLYFIVFLAVTNVFGYLVTDKINAVIFFALVGFLVSNFSKNMTVILLVSIVATNLLMANKTMREGMCPNPENPDDPECKVCPNPQDPTDPICLARLKTEADAAKLAADAAATPADTTAPAATNTPTPDATATATTPDATATTPESTPVVSKPPDPFHNMKGTSSFKNAAPVDGNSRIDYASTLEGAYDNLDKILGSDGINKLTGDTQKLMSQQQKLFDTMNGMKPMLDQAKQMLAGFDLKELGNLANLSSTFASAPTAV